MAENRRLGNAGMMRPSGDRFPPANSLLCDVDSKRAAHPGMK